MISSSSLKRIHEILLICFVFFNICLMGYSNYIEMILCIGMTGIMAFDILSRRYVGKEVLKIACISMLICMIIVLNLFLGRSSGNTGSIYLQIEFVLFLLNLLYVVNDYTEKGQDRVRKSLFFATLISLCYNIYVCTTNYYLRETIYINGSSNQAAYVGIGGVVFAFCVACFSLVVLYEGIKMTSKVKKICYVIIYLLSAYYISVFEPAATVVFLFYVASVIILIYRYVYHKVSTRQRIFFILAIILLTPLAAIGILNGMYISMNQSSRLFKRVEALLQMFRNPSVLITSIYFMRVQMIISDIVVFFASVKNFLFGTGYDLISFDNVIQQMNRIGIGYHCSMLDWFPTYGVICGLALWRLFHYSVKLTHQNGFIRILIWVLFILFCFLDYGFYTMPLLFVIVFPKKEKVLEERRG